ncbi:MAG: phosphotransferase [Alphaproteobacteria bacterium]|nr:phosphotransferase [Alphaproteobacteria bacterium]
MSRSTTRANPLTEDEIGAVVGRMGLLAPGDKVVCVPLDGGVSSEIWRVEIGARRYCLKRALARLKVPQLWEAPIERNDAEWKWLAAAAAIWPGSVPRLVGQDRDAGLFVMDYLDPGRYPSWKSQLRDGILRAETAVAVAARLAAIHAATAGRSEIAAAFDTGDCFYAIRLEPYLVATGRVHTDLAPLLEALSRTTLAAKRALVHGDISPKNILIGPDGPVFIDSECAWYGEPAFDLAFCLNHLLLKCLWQPQNARGFLRLFERLTETYLTGVTWQPRAEMESLTAGLLPALLLGRIDGKSPIEYITNEREKNCVRNFARRFIATRVDRLDVIRDAWGREVHA